MKTIRLLLKGRVQGVGYRYHASHQASKYDVNGFAKNLRDGSVEIVGQSENPAKLALFARECRRGPFLSKPNII